MEEMTNPADSFMSAEIKEISAALSAFQGEVEQPALNKENPYFKSRYVDLSGVLKAVQKTMAKHGLSVSQIIHGGDIITLLVHVSGQWFKSVCPIGSYKNQQDRGSAITYTKRYALCAILGIAADTDDDGNAATDADKKAGNAGNSEKAQPASRIAFTGAQLNQAIQEVNAATTEEQFKAVWDKWANTVPAITQQGTEFFKVACRKINAIKNPSA